MDGGSGRFSCVGADVLIGPRAATWGRPYKKNGATVSAAYPNMENKSIWLVSGISPHKAALCGDPFVF